MARLAVDLVSGPAGVAAILRQGLLDKPYNTPSACPLDIGYSDTHPRPTSAAPSCCATAPAPGRSAAARRSIATCTTCATRQDGGETSVENCVLVCQYPSRRLHPPPRLAAHPPPRRHHRGPKSRRQTGPQIPRIPKPPSGLGQSPRHLGDLCGPRGGLFRLSGWRYVIPSPCHWLPAFRARPRGCIAPGLLTWTRLINLARYS